MSRLAVIHLHQGAALVNWFVDTSSDLIILQHVTQHGKSSHTIKKVQICEVLTEYDNITPIENWLKITQRLTK